MPSSTGSSRQVFHNLVVQHVAAADVGLTQLSAPATTRLLACPASPEAPSPTQHGAWLSVRQCAVKGIVLSRRCSGSSHWTDMTPCFLCCVAPCPAAHAAAACRRGGRPRADGGVHHGQPGRGKQQQPGQPASLLNKVDGARRTRGHGEGAWALQQGQPDNTLPAVGCPALQLRVACRRTYLTASWAWTAATAVLDLSLSCCLLWLQNHLQWDRAHILGFSMGGMVGQSLAVLAPQRVQSLTLLSTSCGGFQIVPHSWSGLKVALKMVMARCGLVHGSPQTHS